MEELKHLILKSFEENSLIWFFISTILGGFIGATFKIFFENFVPFKLSSFRETNTEFQNYLHKLLLSAKHVDNRLDFTIKNREGSFFHNNNNSKLSFYYAICQYFCWMRILQENALNKFIKQPKRYRKFIILFFDVHKSLCSSFHFKEISDLKTLYDIGGAIPAYEINFIVDSMLANVDENKTIIKSAIISQSEFIEKYNTNIEFKSHFNPFDNWMNKISDVKENIAWNRLLLFSYQMKLLIKYIDCKNNTTRKIISLNYRTDFHDSVYENILKDKSNYKKNKIKTTIEII